MLPHPTTCWWDARILGERGGCWGNSRLAEKKLVIKSDWLRSGLGTLRGTRHSEHWEVAQHLVSHGNTPPVTHWWKRANPMASSLESFSVWGLWWQPASWHTKNYCCITVRECGRWKWKEWNGISLAKLFPTGSSSSSAAHVRSNQRTRTKWCLRLFFLAVLLNFPSILGWTSVSQLWNRKKAENPQRSYAFITITTITDNPPEAFKLSLCPCSCSVI